MWVWISSRRTRCGAFAPGTVRGSRSGAERARPNRLAAARTGAAALSYTRIVMRAGWVMLGLVAACQRSTPAQTQPSDAGALVFDGTSHEYVEFEAEVMSVEPSRDAANDCVEVDCRFVLSLKIISGGGDRVRVGDVLKVGIHSPSRFFATPDPVHAKQRFRASYSDAGLISKLEIAR